MNTITVKWDSKNGGCDRTKTIDLERLQEYLSYGWTVIENSPLPVEKPVEVIQSPVEIEQLPKQRGRKRKL